MLNFSNYYLLTEAIQKPDLIDLYIILAMPPIEDPAYDFIAGEIVKETSRRIIQECESIILRELRHLGDKCSTIEGMKDFYYHHKFGITDIKEFKKETEDNDDLYYIGKNLGLPELTEQTKGRWNSTFRNILRFTDYLVKSFGSESSKQYHYTELTINQVNRKLGTDYDFGGLSKFFTVFYWSNNYGGDSWKNITLAVEELIKAKTPKEFLELLDRLVDLVHNSGSLLEKFKGYKEGWFKYILDIKGRALNIHELLPYASKEVRKLFRSRDWWLRMTKGLGGEPAIGRTDQHRAGYEPATSIAEAQLEKLLVTDYQSMDFIALVYQNTRNIIPALEKVFAKISVLTKEKIKTSFKFIKYPKEFPDDSKRTLKNKLDWFNYEAPAYLKKKNMPYKGKLFLTNKVVEILEVLRNLCGHPTKKEYDYQQGWPQHKHEVHSYRCSDEVGGKDQRGGEYGKGPNTL